ncbi:SDR family NAD(P)-dependent oxidoreductase [Streptomyces sp. NPDC056227]|uniref:SDR family NAD(P)-dependent oxidoreductase n=1 Tax=Streptomyces sp. NPDC056227 TaxID=3345753 RepID=UPI0035D78491
MADLCRSGRAPVLPGAAPGGVAAASQALGHHLVLDLVVRGAAATLLLHGRDGGRLDDVAAEVRSAAPGTEVRTQLADLADLDQVRAMAARILDTEPRLDVLVNKRGSRRWGHPGRA